MHHLKKRFQFTHPIHAFEVEKVSWCRMTYGHFGIFSLEESNRSATDFSLIAEQGHICLLPLHSTQICASVIVGFFIYDTDFNSESADSGLMQAAGIIR